MCRGNHSLPVVIVLKEPTLETLGEALNEHVDQYVRRGSRIPNDFFNELCQRCVISVEKDRSEKQRRINEKRMDALITIAKMSDRDIRMPLSVPCLVPIGVFDAARLELGRLSKTL